MDQQFMFGSSLLVAPVMEQGASSKEVYLPPALRWYDAHTGQEVKSKKGWLGTGQQSMHQVCQAVAAGAVVHYPPGRQHEHDKSGSSSLLQ